MNKFSFAEVIVPVPVPNTFTYKLPEEDQEIQVGVRVVVPFGKRQIVTGVVIRLHNERPEKYSAKSILEVLEITPSITPLQIKFFQWMAHYYMGFVGEVLNNALPSGLKVHSESRMCLHPEYDIEANSESLSDQEFQLLSTLKTSETLTYEEAKSITGVDSIYRLIKSLYYKEALLLFEHFKEKYKPKIEKRIRLSAAYLADSALDDLILKLDKKQKQADVLLKYLQDCPVFQAPEKNDLGMAYATIKQSGLSESSLKTLVKNGVFELFTRTIPRVSFDNNTNEVNPLSKEQNAALDKIFQCFEDKNIALLEGVTGSGKTEVYIHLIKTALENGGQVLYMLPEIALSTQIVNRLSKIFGPEMGVYHSKYSDNERIEVWNGLLRNKINLVVGVRSSVFLPFSNLALVIIDEEHEPSYKQFEKSPRYQARDSVLKLAQLTGAKVLMGSATPSIETLYNVAQKRFAHVDLSGRYQDVTMPSTQIIDLTRAQKKKQLKGSFSQELLDAIGACLEEKRQAIIFQNRRGYAPLLNCNDCGWIPSCESCAVSLTYHLHRNELKCHYCGFTEFVPKKCESCGSTNIQTIGFGTEKLEEELEIHFPEARISRMDQDTTKNKYGYQQIISDFENGSIDILVGTQMVSKGLDFAGVKIVGVMNADSSLFFPDFRSHERAYQLMVQVSGRAGRKEGDGMVYIQTRQPEHNIFQQVINADNRAFYDLEIEERKANHYPPFVRLIKITIKNREEHLAEESAQKYCNLLNYHLGAGRVLGPITPIISRIRNLYIREILVKVEKNGVNIQKVKQILFTQKGELLHELKLKSTKVIFDVDPY